MLDITQTTIAHYQLQRRLARGGMSEVYLANDLHTHHMVAIKLVDSSYNDYCMRFQREVKAIAGLSHDHILPAFEYGEYGPWCYLVMPYIDSGTLRERLAQGPLTPEEAGVILEQLVSALDFAHAHGIIHRDIKPSNILLRDGQHVYLADFGLAKMAGERSNITQAGCLMGTPEYMAPELAEEPATTSSDIYALGVVLYQMLTGHVPFKSSTPVGVYWKQIREQPTPPSRLNPAISPTIERVVLRALEKNPQRRFKTARNFAQAYEQALGLQVRSHSTLFGDHSSISSLIPYEYLRRVKRSYVLAMGLMALLSLLLLPMLLGFTAPYSHVQAAQQAGKVFSGVRPPHLPNTSSVSPNHPLVPPQTTSVGHNHMFPGREGGTSYIPQPQDGAGSPSDTGPGRHKHRHRRGHKH